MLRLSKIQHRQKPDELETLKGGFEPYTLVEFKGPVGLHGMATIALTLDYLENDAEMLEMAFDGLRRAIDDLRAEAPKARQADD
jgi:hypothetical protein